jgi:polyhydroxyalkanoate synthesis regulator phasin
LDKNQVQYYSDPQKALMQQHDRSDINEGTAKIDAKKKDIESLKQQLSDLEDQLRKAGGDPGWAR